MKFTDEQINHMVERFLGWNLPDDFNPDAGISFKREYNENSPFGPSNHEPSGTNLFCYEQAKKMVIYMLDGIDA